MDDTAPEVRPLLAERYRALCPEDRVRLCLDMFDFARAIVESSLPEDLQGVARKRKICERFYGVELANQVFPN